MNNTQTMSGTVSANPRGFGFIRCEDGQDFFVPPPQMKYLIPGDIVNFTLEINPRNQQTAANVTDVTHRPESFWLGQTVRMGDRLFLEPDDAVHMAIRLPAGTSVSPDDVVQVRIPEGFAIGSNGVDAALEAILGPRNDRDFDVRYAIAKWRLPVDFPKSVLSELTGLTDPTPEEAESFGVKDFTDKTMVTIDGESTKDFDDAVGLEDCGDTWLLHVGIADVSRYVRPGTALDLEAQRRATSVYLSDRTLPMLPRELSNGLCSLNPGAYRYALVCSLSYNKAGQLLGHVFSKGLIRSAARLTYQQVADGVYPADVATAVPPMMSQLWQWFETQVVHRKTRGLSEDHGAEPKLKISEDGSYSLEWVPILRSNELVEECMLAANRAAAERLATRGGDALFRHQEGLDPEKWEEARAWLVEMGVAAPLVPSLKDLRALVSEDRGELTEQIAFRVRRSMTPAVYDDTMSSHFSLDFVAYTHFTSPIRRYADLLVHRMLLDEPVEMTSDLSEHLSLRSRAAKVSSRYPWERLKRRLVWRSEDHTHKAQVIGQTPRGFKAAVLRWEVLTAVNAPSLVKAGWAWDEVAEQWKNGSDTLSVGQTLNLQLSELKEEGVTCELNSVLVAA